MGGGRKKEGGVTQVNVIERGRMARPRKEEEEEEEEREGNGKRRRRRVLLPLSKTSRPSPPNSLSLSLEDDDKREKAREEKEEEEKESKVFQASVSWNSKPENAEAKAYSIKICFLLTGVSRFPWENLCSPCVRFYETVPPLPRTFLPPSPSFAEAPGTSLC